MKDLQLDIRGDGKLPVISVEADNLAEATYKTIIACYDKGTRVETPKHQKGGSLGYDADILVRVKNPLEEPRVCYAGMHDDGRGVVQYVLEVTHGIHNHWLKSEENPEWWGYTYNQRFLEQLPYVFKRIEHDWNEKKGQWKDDMGRPSGRDYNFTIWRPGEDIDLDQEDPPCWQRGQLRFLMDEEGSLVMNYLTDWRSRDLYKAWNENNIGQTELMRLMRDKVEDMLQVPIKMGSYIDRASSLHLYGLYLDQDGTGKQIERMKTLSYEKISSSYEDYVFNSSMGKIDDMKKLVYAQTLANDEGHGKNLPKSTLDDLGYDVDNIQCPEDWDSWDKRWDKMPDKSRLARVTPFSTPEFERVYSKLNEEGRKELTEKINKVLATYE